MGDSVTTQTLINGSKNLVIKFTSISDGTGEAAVKKVDVSSYTPTVTSVKISKIWFSTSGMSVQILWDATSNVLAYTVAADQTGCLDFKKFGGIHNNAGTGVTGDILFTVAAGAAVGSSYTIILELVKE